LTEERKSNEMPRLY